MHLTVREGRWEKAGAEPNLRLGDKRKALEFGQWAWISGVKERLREPLALAWGQIPIVLSVDLALHSPLAKTSQKILRLVTYSCGTREKKDGQGGLQGRRNTQWRRKGAASAGGKPLREPLARREAGKCAVEKGSVASGEKHKMRIWKDEEQQKRKEWIVAPGQKIGAPPDRAGGLGTHNGTKRRLERGDSRARGGAVRAPAGKAFAWDAGAANRREGGGLWKR